jgi:LysM repeat protein
MKRLLSLCLAICLLAAIFVAPAEARMCGATHTVKAGENLYRIGLQYGVSWPSIAAANNLANPNLIFVGQQLCIPMAGPTATGPTPTGPTPTRTATATSPAVTATPTRTPTATPSSGTPAATAAPPFAIPTITIIAVVRNSSVTLQTANFPANQSFNVTMGPIGSLGVGGHAAGSVNSGAGGAFTATVTIPTQMVNASAIAIRLQSASGYYSYGWFYNSTFP